MTFSYDASALDTELNKIRLYIGDVDEDDALLADEEIAQVQADSTTFLRRCASCCRLICSKLARRVDSKLSSFTENAEVIYERYLKMAEYYEAQSSMNYPWSGAIYVDDKDATEDDYDDDTLVKPKFQRGKMDNTR